MSKIVKISGKKYEVLSTGVHKRITAPKPAPVSVKEPVVVEKPQQTKAVEPKPLPVVEVKAQSVVTPTEPVTKATAAPKKQPVKKEKTAKKNGKSKG